MYNDERYYINIRNSLITRANAVKIDSKSNLHNLAVLSEDYYRPILNTLLGWSLVNANAEEQNASGIDLIDRDRHIAVQVSVICDPKHIREKIKHSIHGFNIPDDQDWHFFYVPITDKAPVPRKNFDLPKGLIFDQKKDILDIARIMQLVEDAEIDVKAKISELVDKFDKEETQQHKLVSYLKTAFDREKGKNPSMQMERVIVEIIPKGHFSPRVHVERGMNSYSSNCEKPLSFGDALKRVWSNNETCPLCLFGIGGLGKTVTLLSHDWTLPVIYIPVRALQKGCGIQDYIRSTTLCMSEDYWQAFTKLLNKPVKDGPNLVIIVDGFNEVDQEHRNDLYLEINNAFSNKEGVQMILSSRYDIGPELNNCDAVGLELETLTRDQVSDYLRDLNLPIPKPSSRTWEFITTPLMLHLYSRSEHIFFKNSKHALVADSAIQPREPKNAGAIVWNFLQSEILRCSMSHQGVAIPTIATMFLAPFIAYNYRLKNVFSVNKTVFSKHLKVAISTFGQAEENDNILEQINNNMAEDGLDFSKDFRMYYPILIKNLCLFYENDGQVEFIHQHFRDALSAIYIYIALKMSLLTPDVFLMEVFDKYVESFFVDLLVSEPRQESTWSLIWETYRQSTLVHNQVVLTKMLWLYKAAFGNDLSAVNFSKLNLDKVSLLGFILNHSPSGHFKGTKLTRSSFFEAGHRMAVSSLSWQSGGDSFLSASHDCTLRIWDKHHSSMLVSVENTHKVYIRAAQWCPSNSNIFASGGDDQELVLWEYENQEWHNRVVTKCDSWIRTIAWAADGKQIAFGTNAGGLYCYSPDEGVTRYNCTNHAGITLLRFTNDGRIITGSGDPKRGYLSIWKRENNNEPEQIIEVDSRILDAQLDCNTNSMVVVTLHSAFLLNLPEISGHYKIGDLLKSGSFAWIESKDLFHSASIRFTEKGYYCAIFSTGNVSIFRGERSHNEEFKFARVASQDIDVNDLGVVSCAQWNNHCTELIFGSRNGSIWRARFIQDEANYDRLLPTLVKKSAGSTVRCSAWNHNGSILAVGYDDNTIRLWNVRLEKVIRVIFGHFDSVKSVAWSKDNVNVFASGSDDGSIRVWNMNQNNPIAFCNPCSSPVNCIVWLTNNRLLAGTDNGYLVLWNVQTKKYKILEQHEKSIYSILVTSDESYFLSGGNDPFICVWNIDNNLSVTRFPRGHAKEIRAMAWGRNEKSVYTAANDQILLHRDFDSENGNLSQRITAMPKYHTNFVYSVVLSCDTGKLISGSTDATIGIWDTIDDSFVTGGTAHNGFVWNVSACPSQRNGMLIASCSSDGTLKIWDIEHVMKGSALTPIATLRALPNISIVDCDFRRANFEDSDLTRLVSMNGGIVEYADKQLSLQNEQKQS